MSRIPAIGSIILCLGLWAGAVPAQAGGFRSPGSAVVAASGGYQLTEAMLGEGILLARILASADLSAGDTAALRNGLIDSFYKTPAKDAKAYADAKKFNHTSSRYSSLRFKYFVWLAQDENNLSEFEKSALGKMVLKYNPIIVNSGGFIITQRDVDWQFEADAFVAQTAGVAPFAPADKERFVKSLPARFASMSASERENLRGSQIRYGNVVMSMEGAPRTRAAIESYIKANVHSPDDVSRVARQVENDSSYQAKYNIASVNEKLGQIRRAQAVNRRLEATGQAVRDTMRSSQLPVYRDPDGSGPCIRNCLAN